MNINNGAEAGIMSISSTRGRRADNPAPAAALGHRQIAVIVLSRQEEH